MDGPGAKFCLKRGGVGKELEGSVVVGEGGGGRGGDGRTHGGRNLGVGGRGGVELVGWSPVELAVLSRRRGGMSVTEAEWLLTEVGRRRMKEVVVAPRSWRLGWKVSMVDAEAETRT